MNPVSVVLTMAVVQNVVLIHYLGIHPLTASVRDPRRAALLSGGVTLALLWVAVLFWVGYHSILVPLGVPVLATLLLVLIIALTTIAVLRVGSLWFPFHRRAIRHTVPAILVNVTVFVVPMALAEGVNRLGLALLGAIAAGLGLFMVLVPLAAVRDSLQYRRIPPALRGEVIVYLAAALMALALLQLEGLLQRFLVPIL